ncbi:MAG: flippase-like domain-containing protein [Candidatus Micrarchaeota archaeon]|nr:flippase-like domain-containing protein [Candidatus Micrarchaeota archaeon]
MATKQKKASIWSSITKLKKVDREGYLKLIKRIRIFVTLAFIASAVVFIAIAVFGGIQNVVGIILSANLGIFALAFVCQFSGYLIKYWKWTYYLKRLGIKVPLRKNLMVYLSIYSMDITPGMIGRIVAAYTLRRITKIKFTHILPVVTMDIFTDFLGVGILAFIAAVWAKHFVLYVLLLDIVLVLPFLFLTNAWVFNFIKNKLKGSKFVKMFSLYGDEYYASQSVLNKHHVYLVSLAFTLPAAFLTSLTLYFSLVAVGVHPQIGTSTFIWNSAQVFGMISAVPGNIGITDGTLVALLGTYLNLQSDVSSAVTIMSRLATLWLGFISGTIFLFYTMRYWKPKAHEILHKSRALKLDGK